jgi:hypothetical protein
MTKSGITAERHIEIGQRLAAIAQELQTLLVEVGNSYPRTGVRSIFAQALWKVDAVLSKARSDGDDISCVEHDATWCAHWYYPGAEIGKLTLPHVCATSRRGMY